MPRNGPDPDATIPETHRSRFTRRNASRALDGGSETAPEGLHRPSRTITSRISKPSEGSHTGALVSGGADAATRKVIEDIPQADRHNE
jgi:hypothetical protein